MGVRIINLELIQVAGRFGGNLSQPSYFGSLKPDHYHGVKFPKAELERRFCDGLYLRWTLFDYLKINPLCCPTVFLFGQSVGHDNLQDVFAGKHICAELYDSTGGEPL